MRKKKVVLLSNHSLFTTSVQKLLQDDDSFTLSIILADDPQLKDKMARTRPRVIILDTGDATLGEGVITRLIEENPGTRVVALNLDHGGMKVYQMKHVQQTDLEGLLEAIRSEGLPAG